MSARARWKELCMDTAGGDTLGRFWGPVLGLRMIPGEVDGDLEGGSEGGAEGRRIVMCPVPEPKTVKNRVHIDVYADSLDELTALGASIVRPAEESGLPWTVLLDPEGNEFCAFLDLVESAPAYRFFQLVVDANNAHEISRWWAGVFDAEVKSHHSDGSWWGVEGVPGLPFTALTFGAVPEPKTVKNRIHWDVCADVEDMVAAGATLLRAPNDGPSDGPSEDIGWHVMADPEGNEFCVFET